jgi:hydrogenase maturation protease
MKPSRIICIGNPYCVADAAGRHVLDYLRTQDLPSGVEVIDGGLAGLNLLGLVEDSDRVVFVDQVTGYGRDGEIVVLDAAAFCEGAPEHYGHDGGLAFLLRVLTSTGENGGRDATVVGIEGCVGAAGIERAARCAVAAAMDRRPT